MFWRKKSLPETTVSPDAQMTKQNILAWRNLESYIAVQRLGDWAAMLEDRLAELDPNYQTHPWGRNTKSIWR